MRKMGKLVDYIWSVFTLKYVENKSFVWSYTLFLFLLLLFEIFLVGLYSLASVWLISYGILPNLIFFLSGGVLIILLSATIPAVIEIIKKWKQLKSQKPKSSLS